MFLSFTVFSRLPDEKQMKVLPEKYEDGEPAPNHHPGKERVAAGTL
jgi:hypothetical protein